MPNSGPHFRPFCQESPVTASRGSSQKDQWLRVCSTFRRQILISPSPRHLSKSIRKTLSFNPVFFHLSPSQDLCFTPLLSLSSSRFTLIFDMVTEQAGSVPGSFATSFCPVKQSRRRLSRRRGRSHHHERKEKNLIGLQSFKESWTSRCSPTMPNSIPDSRQLPHLTESNLHMSNGQRSCWSISQSLSIKSSSRFFKRSRVTKMSSQRVFSLRESCQRSLSRSRKKSRPRSRHIRCKSFRWSRRSSRQNQGRDQSSQWKESITRINIHEGRQLSQRCIASLNIRRAQHHGSS